MDQQPAPGPSDRIGPTKQYLTVALNDRSPESAASDLLPIVYEQLRLLARQKMAQERSDHTLQPTALVHEAYLRLMGDQPVRWESREQFFRAAAEAMRRILIEHARSRGTLKRGAGHERVPLNLIEASVELDREQILVLDEIIQKLEAQSPDLATVVRLRFYAGLSIDETAATLNVSPSTIDRQWTYARAWLFREWKSREV